MHLLDLRTIALVYVAVRIGLAMVLAYIWSVQRNYPPAKDWALGSILTAVGLFLIGLRHLVSPFVSELLSNALLFPGWMIFDFGIVKACGRQPPYRLGSTLCILVLLGMAGTASVQPESPALPLLHHSILILFDLTAAYACLHNVDCTRRQTFRAIAVLLIISAATFAWKLAQETFGVQPSLPEPEPKILLLLCSVTIYPMLTMLLALQTSQKLQEELNTQARQDVLTGAYNRRAFVEFTERTWAQSSRCHQALSLLLLDIDNFKIFNDRYGHQTGDQALTLVSQTALRVLRKNDVWCRYGGEEFVALLPDTDLVQALAAAERIRQAIAQVSLQARQGSLSLSVSIGVAQRRTGHGDWNDLLAESDAALYQAKAAGRNCVKARDGSQTPSFEQPE
jgi:diguanylate cyclase (GGDEF)-like protein